MRVHLDTATEKQVGEFHDRLWQSALSHQLALARLMVEARTREVKTMLQPRTWRWSVISSIGMFVAQCFLQHRATNVRMPLSYAPPIIIVDTTSIDVPVRLISIPKKED